VERYLHSCFVSVRRFTVGAQADFIRNSAKAIIIENGMLLAIKANDSLSDWYLLPGGGQDPSESLHEALRRECQEEIGVEVEVGTLRFIREYFGNNHEFAEQDRNVHQIEFMFLCSIAPGHTPTMGPVPDGNQTGIEWLPLGRLDKYRLYPQALRSGLMHLSETSIPVYQGEIN
jgi:8-oxo-dGTP diphosphatase